MITLTLRFPDDTFPTMRGEDAGRFLLSMLVENPQFAVKAATEVEVRGDFGKFTEER